MASDIIRSLTHRRNDSMRILNLYNVSEPLDVRVLENFKNIPNLKELILRQCKSVSDSELQVIIKYLIHLRKLVITTPFGSVSFFWQHWIYILATLYFIWDLFLVFRLWFNWCAKYER